MRGDKYLFACLLVRLYPRSWRERYGDEMVHLLMQHHITLKTVADILIAATDEHFASRVLREGLNIITFMLLIAAVGTSGWWSAMAVTSLLRSDLTVPSSTVSLRMQIQNVIAEDRVSFAKRIPFVKPIRQLPASWKQPKPTWMVIASGRSNNARREVSLLISK